MRNGRVWVINQQVFSNYSDASVHIFWDAFEILWGEIELYSEINKKKYYLLPDCSF